MLKKRFWVAVIIQLAIIAGIMTMHSYTMATGRPVMLRTRPVDPWDIMRGQYIHLNYEISQLEQGKVTMEGLPYQRGEQLWVTLRKEPDSDYWGAVLVSNKRQAGEAGDIVLAGRVLWAYPQKPGTQPEEMQVFVSYGIEQFYVPEGEGLRIESTRPQLTVEALVDARGRAAVRRVFANGKELQWR